MMVISLTYAIKKRAFDPAVKNVAAFCLWVRPGSPQPDAAELHVSSRQWFAAQTFGAPIDDDRHDNFIARRLA
jgi:hypothetical protein